MKKMNLYYVAFLASWVVNLSASLIYIHPSPFFLVLVHPFVLIGIYIHHRSISARTRHCKAGAPKIGKSSHLSRENTEGKVPKPQSSREHRALKKGK